MGETQFLPPYTAFLVRAIDLVFALINAQEFYRASCVLYNLIPFLDPEIKKKEKIKEFQERHRGLLIEASMVGGMNRGHVSRNRLEHLNRNACIVVNEYLPIVVDEIHAAGYFIGEKMGRFFDPAQGRTSGRHGRTT